MPSMTLTAAAVSTILQSMLQVQGAPQGRQAAQVHGEEAQEEQQQGPPLAAWTPR